MTLCEVRAEMDTLSARTLARGAFHPAEYWRMKELARMEESLLGTGDGSVEPFPTA